MEMVQRRLRTRPLKVTAVRTLYAAFVSQRQALPPTLVASPTQILSQLVLQQKMSAAQAAATAGSHTFSSTEPTSHGECEQAPSPAVNEVLSVTPSKSAKALSIAK